MAEKLKLEEVGDTATFTVTACNKVTTKYGGRFVFLGTEADGTEVETPLIPDTAALKQLDRIDLNDQTVIGETLTFSRAHNPTGKPYWNINPASGTPAPSKRLPPPEAAKGAPAPAPTPAADPNVAILRRDAVLSHYLVLWDTIALHLAQTSKKYGYALDAAAIQAASATVWISWKDRGIQPDGIKAVPATAPAPEKPSRRIPSPPVELPPENPADNDLPF